MILSCKSKLMVLLVNIKFYEVDIEHLNCSIKLIFSCVLYTKSIKKEEIHSINFKKLKRLKRFNVF
jgi:hypothetical protein